MSENIKAANLRLELPCGCWRDVVRRKAPKFHTLAEPCGDCGYCRTKSTAATFALAIAPADAPQNCERIGQPVLDADGAFVMVDNEDIEEGQCEKHAAALNERQLAAGRAITAGDTAEAMRLMAGYTDGGLVLPAHEGSPTKDEK